MIDTVKIAQIIRDNTNKDAPHEDMFAGDIIAALADYFESIPDETVTRHGQYPYFRPFSRFEFGAMARGDI